MSATPHGPLGPICPKCLKNRWSKLVEFGRTIGFECPLCGRFEAREIKLPDSKSAKWFGRMGGQEWFFE